MLTYVTDDERVIKDILVKEFQISARLLRKLKLNDRIFCNGKVAWVNGNAKPGDEIKVNIFFEEEAESIKSEVGKLDILYEDDSLLLINKSGNMVSHPTCLHQSGTLANFVKGYFESKGENIKVRFVNRLDRETSGVIVLAKNDYVQDILSKEMQSGEFSKEYIAVVHGVLDRDFGTVDLPIKREPDSIMTRMVAPDGERAVTHFEVLRRLSDMTVLKLRLETGRTHQIRVHLKAIGYPIVGDGLYSDVKTDLISRQALHSYRTGFVHPVSREKVMVTAGLPEDILDLIKVEMVL